jgi:nucleotide-binding universal stress UspA family protein
MINLRAPTLSSKPREPFSKRKKSAESVKGKNESPIICGTDFSDAAIEAVDIAAAIARRLETKLVLVHVDESYGIAAVDSKLFEAAVAHRRPELDRMADRLRGLGTDVDEKLLCGSAFDKLVTVATEARAQLIVVGAIGHSLARRLFVGSVAERTAEASPVPTLVVRPKSRLASWIRGEHELKVLVGYDFSGASDAALGWVNQLRQVGNCQITVLYSNWPPDEARRIGYEGPLPLMSNPKGIQKNLERDLKKRVAKFLPKQEVNATVEPGGGTPEGYLFQMAIEQNVDLLVVGTHQRHGLGRILLGSVSRAVLHHAKVAVAVVPPVESSMRKSAT